ncbi:Era-like GTP-binding protein [Methermicoccus shengliensis]|uniref:GTP-binding protein n=1 Tax=Methermicoccus shengliensis TaxID=660064 RepID=A0A832RXW2_9EURY|nr:Era-like GTP-binding protein [Methermicoccus shengliensis]KUK04030.1 MAG: Small GTP-binding protein domain protein [Euryarchaeota archaeon 55_53]KUK29722.1 MAG: Small GTP-binding protein domain protein [Methanosarcinales archeaon 56_1174]MDI3488061.1 GTPase [Methanosarcinales archaeon]MDN5295682.1 GTPase [Methanosarcinales archaeon]HIH70329.1 GTP-binding protein [Methermicoccus shengliensis]
MPFLIGLRRGLSSWIFRLLGRKRTARIGIYGPPNAGKTTLANRILRDWSGEAMGSVSPIPHETRRARRREGVMINANGRSVVLDVVDTPGLATKIDFHEFMAHGLSEEEAKRRAKEATEGVIEAVKWLDDLDGVILVMDATEDPFTQVNVVVVGNMEARELPLIIVANKIDLEEANPQRIESAFPQHPIVPISALEGTNIEQLYEEITRRFGR